MRLDMKHGKRDMAINGLSATGLSGTGFSGVLPVAMQDGVLARENGEDEGRRAGFLALGMLLIAVAVIATRVPLMPMAVFLSAAALCLLQLSQRALRFVEEYSLTRAILACWSAIGGLSRGLRAVLLLIIGLIALALLLMRPHSTLLYDLLINLFFGAALILFAGPGRGREK